MKLLISTYSCAPSHGSEHGVGWAWTTEAHRQGHQVWALASGVHREAIEAANRADCALSGITWVFPEISFWPLRRGVEPRWERTYNLLWQLKALAVARTLQRDVAFDAVHHLTWGGLRAPTFLGRLGPPLIIGPVGGGETTPARLRDVFPLRARITERLRDISNWTICINPLLRDGLTRAAMIFAKTPDTRASLSGPLQRKTACFMELGLAPEDIGQPHRPPPERMNILFVGRLLYWKGVHIALRAMAELAASVPTAQLTIVGKGPELERLKAEARRLKVCSRVTFVPWLPRGELTALYDAHDLFLFPSLHDSSGGVVLEAQGRGLPVVCLDNGGPRHVISAASGVAVAVKGRSTAELAQAIADVIADLHGDRARLAALSAAAIARARQFMLTPRVKQFYGYVAEFLSAAPVVSRQPIANISVHQQAGWGSVGVPSATELRSLNDADQVA